MIDYYFYMLRGRKLNPKIGCKLFNKYKLKSYIPLLAKSGLKIDKNVSIVKPFTFTDGNIEIGNSAYINAGCFFLDAGLVKIGSRTLIGPNCQFYTVTHHVNPKERFNDSSAVIKNINIGDNVWIGGGVIICPGVSIGNNSVIAAGSVVISDVPENVLYAGNPAIFKKNLS